MTVSCPCCGISIQEQVLRCPLCDTSLVRSNLRRALLISRGLHVLTIACLLGLGLVRPLGPVYFAGVAAVAILLFYEQTLVRADDLSQVKRAFDLNGYVGILYLVTTGLAVYLR